MKKTTFKAETIVAFHIGRGGRFNNGGHLTFLGEGKISDYTEDCMNPVMIDENSDSDQPELIEDNSPEAEWTDYNGNSVGLTNAEYQSGIGRINIDLEYNTTYTMRWATLRKIPRNGKLSSQRTHQMQRMLRCSSVHSLALRLLTNLPTTLTRTRTGRTMLPTLSSVTAGKTRLARTNGTYATITTR